MPRSNYARAREFEWAVRDDMIARNYIAVRSAGSKTPADIYAFDMESKVFIQCKLRGDLRPPEWNRFYRYCRSVDAIPVLAMRNSKGRGIVYKLLTGEREAYGRKPMTDWIPSRGERREFPKPDRDGDRVPSGKGDERRR